MAGKGWKGERTATGSLYCRIQEVKSGAVMPWTGHTYCTGEIRFVDQKPRTVNESTKLSIVPDS